MIEIPKADEVRKNMKRVGGYVVPSGGRYGWYSDGKVFVGIHEDDDEIVSIFDVAKEKFIFFDEKTIVGWKLLEEMLKKGRL